jgi:TPP-dependent pyruvate/acetoin dehydrogenase alpha subunit
MTPIDLLVKRLAENGILHSSDIAEANELFKQQIIDAYETSHISMMTSEQYYNEFLKKTEKYNN